ncbi:MAG TPA: delta-60 repeat domain-containing protein, partial [Flavobacteriales bacterium]|nr:delta-60 repeat domain-containing protein [Flavobacteriales bacterium]HMR29299.1 delta-60 repeat domain-containing protein [Flavobacteriales bacterium]
FSVAASAATLGSAQLPFELDTSFRTLITQSNVNSIAILPDGDLLLSGLIRFSGDIGDRGTVKLSSSGARRTWYPYTYGGGKLTEWNGKYYVTGGQTVQRLDTSGALDPGFINLNLGPYFSSGQGGDYHIYPDGSVLFTGSHILTDSIRGFMGSHELVWFTNTGHLDTTAQHRNANGPIYEIEQQPDGKFLCSGWITQYDGQPCPHIFRVHPDGALDTTFQTDFTWGEANAFTTLPDGRILVSGSLKRTGLPDTLRMVRLMFNGDLDPTFNNDLDAPDVNYGNLLYLRHTLLPDGRIVLHGTFFQVDGEPRRGIAMLDANGQLLSSPFSGSGCGNYYDDFLEVNWHATFGMVPDAQGNWYIHGQYIGYDDGTTNDPQQRFVSRLYGLDVGVREVE